MKRILLFLFIFSLGKLFGQDLPCRPTGSGLRYNVSPIGEISDEPSRTNLYRTMKNPNHRYTDSIGYSPCGFLEVLNNFANNNSEKYTGLRVYIGMDTNRTSNEFVLFFVPTKGEAYDETDPDVKGKYLKIVGDHAVPAPEFKAATKKYENSYWKELTQNGIDYRRGQNFPVTKFEETKALWYNEVQITSPIDYYTHVGGLIEYLKDLLRKDTIDSIKVYFGAFQLASQYNYQIDLIFCFFKNGTNHPFFGTGENLKMTDKQLSKIKPGDLIHAKKTKAYNIYKYNDPSFNTGIPCPPKPDGCLTCSCN